MAVQPGLCRTWSETPKTGFLTTRLILRSFSDEESSNNIPIIAGAAGGGLMLLALLAALVKFLLTKCNSNTKTVQPMPSKQTPWALTDTGKMSKMTNSSILRPPNSFLLPGQIDGPEVLPGNKMNPYATAVTVEP